MLSAGVVDEGTGAAEAIFFLLLFLSKRNGSVQGFNVCV